VRGNEGRAIMCSDMVLINEEVRPPSNRNDAGISASYSIPAGLRSVRGVKFTLRRDELVGCCLLDERTTGLGEFWREFCDEKIERLTTASLDDQTRASESNSNHH